MEFAIDPESDASRPWRWFRFLAETGSGYLLIETDAGVVTINPHAAHERIAFERLMKDAGDAGAASQALLIPETVKLPPVDFARIIASLDEIKAMGFAIEEFGRDTVKIDAVPQILGRARPGAVIATIARDLSEIGPRRGALRWKEELIAKSIARSFAGYDAHFDENSAVKLVEELASCRMPYVSPRGKPVMIFTSTRELDRKFNLA
jgi:DNA mismatch repair protein MutL